MTLFFMAVAVWKLQGEDRMRVLRALLCKEYLQIYRDKPAAPADDHDAVHPALPVVHCSDIRGQDGEGLRDRPRPEFDGRGLDRPGLIASGRFKVVGSVSSMKPANEAMLGRKTDMILNVPPGFERDIGRTKTEACSSFSMLKTARSPALRTHTRSRSSARTRVSSMSLYLTQSLSLPVSRCALRGWYNQELDYTT